MLVAVIDSDNDFDLVAAGWAWDFDNDSTIDSHEQAPTWTFNDPGIYTVRLQVSDAIKDNHDVDLLIGNAMGKRKALNGIVDELRLWNGR